LLEEGKTAEARDFLAAMAHHVDHMAKLREPARGGGELSQWSRAIRGMEILIHELRADIALAGEKALRASAFNWFSAAGDRQLPAPLLMPPAVFHPVSARLGDLLLAEGNPADAIEAYQRALRLFPNGLSWLGSLEQACRMAGRDQEADEIAQQIEKLKAGE